LKGLSFRSLTAAGRFAAVLAALAAAPPLLIAAGPGGSIPQPAQPFKVAVDYVHVDVSVTDEGGRFVRDLKADDFEVTEDGKLQQVASFALVDVPTLPRAVAETGAAESREPDVTTNQADATGRVYVLLLDDLHVDPLRTARVKEAARQFIDRYLGSGDVAAVVPTSGRREAAQDFTSRRSLLLAAVDRFSGRKLRSRVLEALEAYQQRTRVSSADPRLDRATDPLDAERADQARRTLQTISALGDLLARAPGRRKTVLLISEGIEYPLQEGVTQTSTGLTSFTSDAAASVRGSLQQAIGAAARANISIYSLDPRGMGTTGAETIDVSAFPENPQLGLTPAAFDDELRQAQASLQILSDETGGAASVSSNDVDAALDRIVRDSGTYYMLGYQSNNRKTDGAFRRIAVRVKRRGVQVRSRTGYAAARGGKPGTLPLSATAEPSALLRDALNAPLPAAAVPLRMFAVPFRGPREESVAVGIEIDARGFRFSQKDGLYRDKVDVAVVALDGAATFETGDRQTLQLQLKPETYATVQARGLRALFRLNLPPGRHQLRAAVNDTGSGLTGTVFYDLDVPEFHKAPLALSGLAIASPRSAATPTPKTDPVFDASLPSSPTGTRTFDADETLTIFFEVYRQPTAAPGPIDIETTVRDSRGAVVFRSQERVAADTLEGGDAGFGYTVRVPLADRPPGSYALRVEARSPRAADAAAGRDVPFTITIK
jgi:VWFA-related protein